MRVDSEPVEVLSLAGHADSITGLAISPDGNHLLSNSMDNSLCKWDLRPFAANPETRCEMVYQGSTHGAEKCLLRCAWSMDQERVVCGSADRYVCCVCFVFIIIDCHILCSIFVIILLVFALLINAVCLQKCSYLGCLLGQDSLHSSWS